MSQCLLRCAYRLIVRLHPFRFRDRFGDEMLWIFDEESRRGATGRLLVDGWVSLIRQLCGDAKSQQRQEARGSIVIADSGVGAGRFAQAAILACMLFGGFTLLLGQRVPEPDYLRRPDWLFCSRITLQAPGHGDVAAKPLRNSNALPTDIHEDGR